MTCVLAASWRRYPLQVAKLARQGHATSQASQDLALANSGQKRSWPANGTACFGSGGRPGTDIDGHGRTQPCCSGRLSAEGRQVNWRRTLDKGGQNGAGRTVGGASKNGSEISRTSTWADRARACRVGLSAL